MILYREPVNKVYCSDFSQTCRDARAAFSVGDVVSSPLAVIQGWKPGPLLTCDGGTIGVAPFLKASHLDRRRDFDVLDPSVGGSWVTCHWKSELLVALLPCSATMIHDSVSCLCSFASRGVVSPSGAILTTRLANLIVHYYILSS